MAIAARSEAVRPRHQVKGSHLHMTQALHGQSWPPARSDPRPVCTVRASVPVRRRALPHRARDDCRHNTRGLDRESRRGSSDDPGSTNLGTRKVHVQLRGGSRTQPGQRLIQPLPGFKTCNVMDVNPVSADHRSVISAPPSALQQSGIATTWSSCQLLRRALFHHSSYVERFFSVDHFFIWTLLTRMLAPRQVLERLLQRRNRSARASDGARATE